MYYQHFGLSGPPFQFTPAPSMLYMSQTHREGVAALEWGLMHESTGFSLLIGESGTGKTTLIASVMARQYPRIHIAYVTNPRLDFEDILRLVLTQLGVEAAGRSKGELLDSLGKMLGQLRPGERVVIMLDEAQGLGDETLEELRLLSNYGRPGENQLQLILAGQPELLRRLMSPALRQFNERIGARSMLTPLDPAESVEYIDYRLRAKGGHADKIFNRRALKYIVAHSGGVPRRINVLCHNSMLLAYSAGAAQVTLAMVREAVADYEDLFNSATAAARAIGSRTRRALLRWLPFNPRKAASAMLVATAAVLLVMIGAFMGRSTGERIQVPAIDTERQALSTGAVESTAADAAVISNPVQDREPAAAVATPVELPVSGLPEAAPGVRPSTAAAKTMHRVVREAKRPARNSDATADEGSDDADSQE